MAVQLGPTKHVVAQGECLASIAQSYGFEDPEELYRHACNESLRRLRPNPNLLFPGDIVMIPGSKPKTFSLATGQHHRIQVQVPKRKVRVRVIDAERKPMGNLPFTLDTGKQVYEGQSDGDGLVEKSVPADTARANLRIGNLTIPILLGHLNPRDETEDEGISATQARLANLGYWPGSVDGILGPRTRAALRMFQGDHNLEVTGEVDDDTVKALFKEHGS